jgi:protein-tyrosine-phosphatase
MISAAALRGIDVTSISRPLVPGDFKEFDYIVAMVRLSDYSAPFLQF